MRIFHLCVYASLILWLSACNSVPTVQHSSDSPCSLTKGLTRPDLIASCPAEVVAYADTEAFDSTLAKALRSSHTGVVVTLEPPLAGNTLSDRLNQWLSAIRDSGGSVKTDKRSLGLLSALFALFGALWERLEDDPDQYAIAAEYDALLHMVEEEVSRITFTRRAVESE